MNIKNINLRAIYKNKTQVMYIFSALFSILYTIFVYIFFRSFFIDSIEKIQSARIDTALWAIFALVVLFPIIEEITDRLIIWYVIEKLLGRMFSFFLVAVIWDAPHLMDSTTKTIALIPMAFFLSYCRYKTDGIGLSLFTHIIYNFSISVICYIPKINFLH